ncbi:MAG: hypothetical protein LBH54_06550, partial [Clostridiales bacterium]|nr:hypothetical protein [Clostridiales bacterium]
MNLAEFFSKTDSELIPRGARITEVQIDTAARTVTVTAAFERITAFAGLKALEAHAREQYRLNGVTIHPKYSPELLGADFMENLTEYISEHRPVAMSVLSGATAAFADGVFTVSLKNNGLETLTQSGCTAIAEEIIAEQFDREVTVDICSKAQTFEEYERNKEEIVKRIEENNDKKPRRESTVLYGRAIKTGGGFTPIKEINEASGRVTVRGELFTKAIDSRETRDHKYIV